MPSDKEIKVILEVLLKDKNFKASLNKAESNLKSSAKKQTSFMDKIKKNWVAIGAAVGVVAIAIKKAIDFTKEFAQYRQGMDALARNTGQNADQIVKKLKEVTKGTVANRDVMLAANRLVALNVTKDTDQMAKLFEIARLKAKAMGITTAQAISDISTGIGRASPLILDNLGIITKGWDVEARAAGKAMNAQFILNKILKQGEEELGRAGASALTGAEAFQRLSAVMNDARLAIGKFASFALLPIVETIADWLTSSEDLASVTQELIDLQTEYKGVLDKLADSQGDLNEEEERSLQIRKGQLQLKIFDVIERLNKLYDRQSNVLKDVTKRNKVYSAELSSIEKKLSDAARSGEEFLNLSQRQVAFLRLTNVQYDKNGKLIARTSEVLKKYNNIQALSVNIGTKLNKVQLELDNTIDSLAKQLNANIITELNLAGLNDKLIEQIKTRAIELEKLGETEKKVVTQRIDLTKELAEIKKIITEENKLTEEEELERRIEFINRIMNHEQLTIQQINALHNARAKMIIKLEEMRVKKIIDLNNIVAKSFQDSFTAITTSYSEGIANMIVEGEIWRRTLGDFINDLIKMFAKLLIKMALVRAAQAALGGIGGFFGLLFNKGGVVPEFYNKGGKVVYAAAGFQPKGSDTVPAMLTPGERVLSVAQNKAFDSLLQSLAFPSIGGTTTNINNDTTNNNQQANTFNVTVEDAEGLLEIADNTNSNLLRR